MTPLDGPAKPCPFQRRHCPNPRCRSRCEHAQQHVWVQHPGDPASWLPVVGWCCCQCGHVHVEAALPVAAVAELHTHVELAGEVKP